MKKLVVLSCVCALFFTSCVKNSSEYKALLATNDSLRIAQQQTSSELDGMLNLLNEVEDNFQSIKSSENYLAVQSATGGELSLNVKERISGDMKFITETLAKNKEQIAKLQEQLKKSGIQSTQLQKTITRLQQELNEKTKSLVFYQTQLAERDEQIAQLNESVINLSTDVESLKEQTEEQKKQIEQQTEAINTVYYCFGTSKELKDQKILVKGQLGTDFNRDYFIRIKNVNELTEIPLFSKKAKLITKHPEGSYEFISDSNKRLTLQIRDINNFWKLSKLLVVEVD